MQGEEWPKERGVDQIMFRSFMNCRGGSCFSSAIPEQFIPRNCGQTIFCPYETEEQLKKQAPKKIQAKVTLFMITGFHYEHSNYDNSDI